VSELRKTLADVKALVDTGQFPAARRSAGPLIDAATTVGYAPLLVEALATSAWLEAESGAPAKAAEIYARVVWSALAAHRDDIAAESAAQLIGIDGDYLGRTQDADRWVDAGEALLQRLGPGHDRIASWFYQGRGANHDSKGEFEAALADMDIALSLKRRALDPHHPDIAMTLQSIANIRNKIGDHQGALPVAAEAVEISREAYGATSPLLDRSLDTRGETLSFLGRHAEAERDLRQAVELSTARYGADHVWTTFPMTGLGKTLIAERRFREATPVLEKVVRTRKESDPNPDEVAEAQFALAEALRGSGQDRPRALALASAARDAYRNLPGRGKQAAEVDAWLADPSK
jgi:tetratricopeptide (TPR) repeat protein